jgi:hypothetical protein
VKFAIVLLTCERTEYTRRTLEALMRYNGLHDITRLHGDDASHDRRGRDYAQQAGFTTIDTPRRQRQGVARMTELLMRAAAEAGVDAVLNLQNDWECAQPIPWDDIGTALGDDRVYCVRLYGAYKSHHGRAGIHHGGREPRRVVHWIPYRLAGYEVGDIHWGHPPSVTRIAEALTLTAGARTESESRERSGRLTRLTVRPVDNVFWHIGKERTPAFHA